METLFKLGVNLVALVFILITLAEWKQKKNEQQQGNVVSVQSQWVTAQLATPSVSALSTAGLKQPIVQAQVQNQDIQQAYWNLPMEERQYLSARLQQMNSKAKP